MMNKKDYIDSVNEIKASEELKRKTIYMLGENKKSPKIVWKLVSATLVFAAIFNLFILNNKDIMDKNEIDNDKSFSKAEIKTLGSFEKLKEIVRDSKNYNIPTNVYKESKVVSEKDNSITNTQVNRVDEGDIVKINEKYLFYISDNKLIIVDCSDKNNLKMINKIEFSNAYPITLYIKDNKLVIISYENNAQVSGTKDTMEYVMAETYTKITVYDIENISQMKIDREVRVQGSYSESRLIEDNVYVVTNKGIYTNGIMKEDANSEDFKPRYTDTVQGKEVLKVDYNDIKCISETDNLSYTMITGFNIKDNKKANVETVMGASSNLYCSENNLYIVNVSTNMGSYARNEIMIDMVGGNEAKTEIYKFNLNNTKILYMGNAKLNGNIINQFSMDEHNGYFRIATTSFDTNKKQNYNNVYILDKDLKEVGKLEGLAYDEKIYSVRFMEERCYLVTYKQVDPLFVIDMSNVQEPKVLGELKIEGFSQYLHPYGENLIIGIGKDTLQTGNGVMEKGMKMSLFDVSDVSNPKELFSEPIGDRGTFSEALYNHKAFLFSKEKNIIAFPISITEAKNGNKSIKTVFQGAVVYGIDMQKGFELKGKISNVKDGDVYKNRINRIVYIGDAFITVSEGIIKAVDMNSFEELCRIKL